MKRPEFLITVTIGETREQYRENNKALDNTMKLVMTGVWEEVNHPGLRLDALEAGACKSSN